MHYPAFVVKNKFRGLNKITFLIPPGADEVTLLTGDTVGNGKR